MGDEVAAQEEAGPRSAVWLRKRGWRIGLAIFAAGVALIFFAYRTYWAIERELSASAVSGRAAISVLAATILTQEIQRLVDINRSLASRVRFSELVALGRWQDAVQIMASVPSEFSSIEQVLLVDAGGELRAASPADATLDSTLGKDDWYRAVASTVQPYRSGVYLESLTQPHRVFFVGAPVLDRNGRLTAVLALRVRAERFAQLFQSLDLEPNGSLVVIDGRGKLVHDSQRESTAQLQDLSAEPMVQRAMRGETGVANARALVQDRSESHYFSAFAATPVGWAVVAQWPNRDVFAARDQVLRRMLVGFSLIVAITAFAVVLLVQLLVQRKQRETERLANTQLESRVHERTEQLEATNRELESFSYSVSHDLRAPLRAIDGYSQLLKEECGAALSDSGKQYIDNVHRNVARMARLIDELLELSRIGRVALEHRLLDMRAMVGDVIAASHLVSDDERVRVEPLPQVQGDAALIRQVWINLLDNAEKYSAGAAAPRVIVSGRVQGGEAIYCVEDNGVGFDMQHYDRLFKPFSRLHGAGEFAGTGVGLALVKRIVERHDGRVWAEGVPGRGTKVYFALPYRA